MKLSISNSQSRNNSENMPIARIDRGSTTNGNISTKSYVFIDTISNFSEEDFSDRRSKNIIKLGDKLTFDVLPYIPNGQRSALYISGISGSGKSTSAAKYIKELRKLEKYKQFPVYFISSVELCSPKTDLRSEKEMDPAYTDINDFYRIDINNPLTLNLKAEELAKSIVLFDDWTAISDKQIKEFIENLLKSLLENSRKNETQIIVINHLTQDYSKTRLIIHECESYFLYPQFNMNSTLKFLKSYLDLDKEQLDEVKKCSATSRWLFIHKSAPRYIITEKVVMTL